MSFLKGCPDLKIVVGYTIRLALILISIVLTGCSSIIQVREDEPLNNDSIFNYDQVNARVDGLPGKLMCLDGTTYETHGAIVTRDSAIFTEAHSEIRHAIPTQSVLRIQRQDHGAGAFTGGVLGLLGGLTTGIVVARAQYGHSPDAGMAVFGLSLEGAGVGLVIGVAVGALEGSTQEFQFQPQQTRTTVIGDTSRSGHR